MSTDRDQRGVVAVILGTRPEAIKLAPVLQHLKARDDVRVCCINTSQHADLLGSQLAYFQVNADYQLDVLRHGQSLDLLLSSLLERLDRALDEAKPDLIVVQGDTTSALAGALAAHHRKMPVVHVEAGLRSGDRFSPFPEEMNRRLITQLATYHMAPTPHNVATLLAEGVAKPRIFLTGNPVVDTLAEVLRRGVPTDKFRALLSTLGGRKLIALTTHRRESFGAVLRQNLSSLSDFVAAHEDVALVFPIHPNPSVRKEVSDVLEPSERVQLIDPLVYPDFIELLRQSWLIVSDSGGVQEEAPTLGKPVIVLRSNTERPEAVACGCARLLGADPTKLRGMLEDAILSDSWTRQAASLSNPFGDGRAAERIVNEIGNILGHRGGSAGLP